MGDSNHSEHSMSSELDKHAQYQLINEITKMQHRMGSVQSTVDFVQNTVRALDRKISDVQKKQSVEHKNASKTEKVIIKMLSKLQNDVDVMKEQIMFIKECWINSAQQYEQENSESDDDSNDQDIEKSY